MTKDERIRNARIQARKRTFKMIPRSQLFIRRCPDCNGQGRSETKDDRWDYCQACEATGRA